MCNTTAGLPVHSRLRVGYSLLAASPNEDAFIAALELSLERGVRPSGATEVGSPQTNQLAM
jgi:hypothetical protein